MEKTLTPATTHRKHTIKIMIFVSIIMSPNNLRKYESPVIQFFYENTKETTW
jgi:hypothetical protein